MKTADRSTDENRIIYLSSTHDSLKDEQKEIRKLETAIKELEYANKKALRNAGD